MDSQRSIFYSVVKKKPIFYSVVKKIKNKIKGGAESGPPKEGSVGLSSYLDFFNRYGSTFFSSLFKAIHSHKYYFLFLFLNILQ